MLIGKVISTFFISRWVIPSFTLAHCTMILFHVENVDFAKKKYTLIVKSGHVAFNLELWENYPDQVSLEICFRSLTLMSFSCQLTSP